MRKIKCQSRLKSYFYLKEMHGWIFSFWTVWILTQGQVCYRVWRGEWGQEPFEISLRERQPEPAQHFLELSAQPETLPRCVPTFNFELCWSFEVLVLAGILTLVLRTDVCNGQFVDFVLHFCFHSALGLKESAISEPLGFHIWHRKLTCHGTSLAFLQGNILEMPLPSRLCCDTGTHVAQHRHHMQMCSTAI